MSFSQQWQQPFFHDCQGREGCNWTRVLHQQRGLDCPASTPAVGSDDARRRKGARCDWYSFTANVFPSACSSIYNSGDRAAAASAAVEQAAVYSAAAAAAASAVTVSVVAVAESSATAIAVATGDTDFAPDVHQHSGALTDSAGISLSRGFII